MRAGNWHRMQQTMTSKLSTEGACKDNFPCVIWHCKKADIMRRLIRAASLDATQEFRILTTSREATTRKLPTGSLCMKRRSRHPHISTKFHESTSIKASEDERNREPLSNQETRDEPRLLFKRKRRRMDRVIGTHTYPY